LPRHRTGDGVHHAGKLYQYAVSHQLDDAAPMFGDEGFQEVSAQIAQTPKRAGLVRAHQGRVADHIGSENSSKPAFQALSPSTRRLAVMGSEIYAAKTALE
jgi:hypothetical protein